MTSKVKIVSDTGNTHEINVSVSGTGAILMPGASREVSLYKGVEVKVTEGNDIGVIPPPHPTE